MKPRLPPVRISYDEMPFESRSSDKPGFMAGHVVEVDTRFPRAKLSPQASNAVSTYLCYIVHKTIKQEEGKEEEEEEEEYDLDLAATSPGAAATNYTEEQYTYQTMMPRGRAPVPVHLDSSNLNNK